MSPQIVLSDELLVGKACPVNYQNEDIGTLVASQPWYHASRTNAAYQAMDNATGIGVEIHFFANEDGDTRYANIANCDRYRVLQVRKTSALLLKGELPLQIDVPFTNESPYYDSYPLEFGRGTHETPIDDSDKPWKGQPTRSSTVGIYDTPYVSDAWGKEGENIWVRFETCAVCERDNTTDTLLSCLSWGYEREYMGGQTGWAEPEPLAMQCHTEPTPDVTQVIQSNANITYYFEY